MDTGTLADKRIYATRIIISEFLWNPQNIMCNKQVSGLQKILHSPVTGVPRIMLRRAEEIFPSVRESMVSVVVCIEKNSVISQFSWQKEKIFYDEFVLVFIMHLLRVF